MSVVVGMSKTVETVVDEANIATTAGSGLMDVFATPMMVALMEMAASQCIQKELEAGYSSVGTAVSVTHDAATPMGMVVAATATVTAVNGRLVEFSVEANDACGKIGKGTHTRFIINCEKFAEKAKQKKESLGK